MGLAPRVRGAPLAEGDDAVGLPQFLGAQDDGLVTFDGTLLRVTPLGQLLVRNVAMLFDAYLKKGASRAQFSRTV